MKVMFSAEEQYLISLLREVLQEKQYIEKESVKEIDMSKLISMARKHAVLSFLYDKANTSELFKDYKALIERESQQTVLQSYRLLFLSKYVTGFLKEEGIPAIVLKGVVTGSLYSVPELRKSGDIDLLVPTDIERKNLISIMEKHNFGIAKEQHSNHHIVFASPDGVDVEIHTMLAEPFAYKKVNQGMQSQLKVCWNHLQIQEIMGVELPVLDAPFHAYELLLHMFQHFVYAGFGLKLLCDWVVIWRQEWTVDNKLLFRKLVDESGLCKFAEVVTAVCVKFLGLEKELFAWDFLQEDVAEEFLRDILDAEEFGYSNSNRMVMMSGTGIMAYIKEFHHQMHLNFPRAGKCFILWPVLWIVTLVKFMRNNRKLRGTTMSNILKEAGRRSKLMEKMNLFK